MNLFSFITRMCNAWFRELKCIFTDEGALLFCIFLPLAYPVLYSWVYNNEVVREAPVAVVDNSHSSLSREFIQKFDASPDVSVVLYCRDNEEARRALGHGEVYGWLYFPEDFATNAGRLEKSNVSVYCDMSYMLTYKAIFQSANAVSALMGSEIQSQLQSHYTKREEEISSAPLEIDEVPIFNTTVGYGNSILPAVLILVIQQAMFLAVGLIVGRDREKGFISVRGVVSALLGKCIAYLMVFAVMFAYVTLLIPHIFGFVSMVHAYDLFMLAVPYLLASVFLAFIVSDLVRYRENVMLVVVFTSLPFLFMTGVSWPQSAIPGFWQGVSNLIPSTFGVRAFVRMSSMGARLGDVAPEIQSLWLQVIVYGVLSVMVMYRRRLINIEVHGGKSHC